MDSFWFIIFLISQSSPGDSVGWTYYDFQHTVSDPQMVWCDLIENIHVDFTRAHESLPSYERNCAYNFYNRNENSWCGDSCISSSRSGYVALGIKSNNAAVCIYHQQDSGNFYRPWVAVDTGPGAYAFTEWPVCPQNTSVEFLWPILAVDDRDNFHCLSRDGNGNEIYYTRSTDGGRTWTDLWVINDPSSSGNYEIFADRFSSPGEVVVSWLEDTDPPSGGKDVWLNISTDYGQTWQGPQNITNFQPTDSIRALKDCSLIIDRNGDPHLVFSAFYYFNVQIKRAWIIHWSSKTGLTFVTQKWEVGKPILPCHHPSLILDRNNGYLYCIFIGSTDDDVAQNGYYNGDIYGIASTDGGLTWTSVHGDSAVNLTNSKSPGAPAGLCHDDKFPSAHPYVETINGRKSLIISFLEDKDAGSYVLGEGALTKNPIRVLIVPCDSIIKVKDDGDKIPIGAPSVRIYPNPSHGLINLDLLPNVINLTLFDASGRLIQKISPSPHLQLTLPPGIYFLKIKTQSETKTEKLVVLR